jgi:putative membrane protein
LTLLGVLLLPVVVGGILVAALYNPVERLDSMNAAIVNEDEAVTVNGQLAPLGRQLTAGLVEGSADAASNLTWTISNPDDAAQGLADGTYNAVITIPEGFSAAATSVADGASATQATISIETAPDARVVDDAITAQIATTAASVFGQELSKTYLENVFVGFTTLSTRLGEAADGATQLADGAQSAASGAAQLPGGATQLATGAGALSDGASQLGAGLDTLASGVGASASGASSLAAGLTGGADTLQSGADTTQLVQAGQATAGYVAQAAADSATVAGSLAALAAQCAAVSTDPAFCATLGGTAVTAGSAATAAGTANAYAPAVAAGIPQFAAGAAQGMRDAAGGAQQLASGLSQIEGGAAQSADGARGLASGATQLGSGADQLATGAQSLSDGVAQLATGTSSLADGLHTAASSVPSYTDAQAQNLATVVSDPVAAKGIGTNLFGASAIPLLAMLALWFGGFGSFIALQAVSRRTLTSRRPSALLAARSLLPAAVIGAVQGLLVAGVVQLAASYDGGTWAVFAALCVVAGVAFAAVNQALVAVFGGIGRWISGLVGVLSLATGVVSTVPGVLSAVAGLLPTSPAYNGMLAALTSTAGIGSAIAGMLIWAMLAFVATTLAVARRRTISARTLLAASPAPA